MKIAISSVNQLNLMAIPIDRSITMLLNMCWQAAML